MAEPMPSPPRRPVSGRHSQEIEERRKHQPEIEERPKQQPEKDHHYAYETSQLLLSSGALAKAAKVLHKSQKDVQRKRKKEEERSDYKSKLLSTKMEQHKDAAGDIQKYIEEIVSCMSDNGSIKDRKRDDPQMTQSLPYRRKTGPQSPKEMKLEADVIQLNRQLTEKDERYKNLELQLESERQRHNEEEHRSSKTMDNMQREIDRLQSKERHVESIQRSYDEEKQQRDYVVSEKAQLQNRFAKLESELTDLRQRNESLQEESAKLSREKHTVQSELQKTNETRDIQKARLESLQTNTDRLALEKSSLTEQLSRAEEGNRQLLASVESRQSEVTNMVHRLKEEEENIRSARKQIENLENALERKDNEYKVLEREKEDVCNRLNQDIKSLKDALKVETAAKDDAQHRFDQNIKTLNESLHAETAAKDDALHRLSELASSRLLDNNPNITDLSDSNRPTKLAEKMMELYDNEWTDACDEFEQHMKKKDEQACAHALLEILKVVYEQCLSTSAEQLKSITELMVCPIKTEAGIAVYSNAVTPQVQQVQKNVKDQRKTLSVTTIQCIIPILSKYVEDNETNEDRKKLLSKQEVKGYVDKCVEICWLMAIQDPPLSLGWGTDGNGHFDTTLFREYTKRGDMIDFVVWPILYLHEGGPLLAKGIAQGKKKE